MIMKIDCDRVQEWITRNAWKGSLIPVTEKKN